MSAQEPSAIQAFDEAGLAQLNNILQEIYRLGVRQMDITTSEGGRLILGNFGGPASPKYGLQLLSASGKKLIEADGAGYRVYDAAGNLVDQIDATGINVFGQGFALWMSGNPATLKGYLGYGIGGGDAIVLSSADGGITLLTGNASGPIKLMGEYVTIPQLSTADPSYNGDTGAMWYRSDLHEVRFWINGAKRKIATVAA